MRLLIAILMFITCVSAEDERRIKYEFNKRTSTLIFYDVIPTAEEIDGISLEEIGERFDECADIYQLQYCAHNFNYTFNKEDKSHTLNNFSSSGLSHLLQLPFPFDVLVVRRDAPVCINRELVTSKMQLIAALDAIRECDTETQKSMYEDILSKLNLDSNSTFLYIQFILNRWFNSGALFPQHFQRLSLANKFLHNKIYEKVTFSFHPSDYGLDDEDYLALLELQRDRIVWGGLTADVAFLATCYSPHCNNVLGKGYRVKRALKIYQAYSQVPQWLTDTDFRDLHLDNDIVVSFRQSHASCGQQYIKDLPWWKRLKLSICWGLAL